jgi:hypothetical protein
MVGSNLKLGKPFLDEAIETVSLFDLSTASATSENIDNLNTMDIKAKDVWMETIEQSKIYLFFYLNIFLKQ